MKTIAILLLSSVTVLGQIATPTFNPFNNGRMPSYGLNQGMGQQQGYYNQQRPNNNFMMPNNYGTQNNYQRPYNNGFQNNYQRPNNAFQNNALQQQNRPTQANKVPLFTRSFRLNNGYLYGRPTLYYDSKSGGFQPWVRRNLR